MIRASAEAGAGVGSSAGAVATVTTKTRDQFQFQEQEPEPEPEQEQEQEGSEHEHGGYFELRIITGRGKHVNSKGERGVLRTEIEAHIKSLEPAGILTVEQAPGNEGCIIVSRESIAQWTRARSQRGQQKT
jgi:hypothetical protein